MADSFNIVILQGLFTISLIKKREIYLDYNQEVRPASYLEKTDPGGYSGNNRRGDRRID